MQNGSVTVTRSSHTLIHLILEDHEDRAMAKLLKDHIDALYTSYGDGGACLVFELEAMLCECRKLLSPRVPRARLAKQFENLANQLWSYTNNLETSESLPFNEFNKFVPTFFATRFTPSVARILDDRFLMWLRASSNTSHSITIQMIDYLIKNYSILVNFFGFRSINESEITKGFWLERDLKCKTKSSKRRILLMQVGDSDCDNSYSEEDIHQTVELVLHSTSINEPYLIITSAILPELTKFRLRQKDIGLLEAVSKEDIHFLENFQMDLIDVEARIANGREGCCLAIPIHQLVLYGPCMELTRQYAQACLDCLRLTRVRILENGNSKGIPVGGVLERMLYYRMGGDRPPGPGRQCLLQWHQEKKIFFDQYSSLELPVASISKLIKENLEAEVVQVVLNALWKFISQLPYTTTETTNNQVEPLSLRIGILQQALHSCAAFIKMDFRITHKLKRVSLKN